ncbi:hypothetical protein [Corynebacterium timonense]|uniref:Sortase family protein n=1 Tax=Corynebacterium timonense TaxID=441500 RepID=A0A1H1L3S0_9CORY|nr:hypothetical protein [Corynebacterium timonense]SDR69133.1 hypothetical protein SAMN04488539_0048 [Corynebacterium timonense]
MASTATRGPAPWVFWVRRVGAVAIAVLLIALVVRACSGGDDEPAPSAARTAVDAPADAPAPTPTRPAPIAAPTRTQIPPSRPVELAIPAIGLRASFEKDDCRVVDDVIDPVTLDEACAYTAPDRPYSLPGTSAPDVVVTAGHTGVGVSAVFDALYDGKNDRHNVAVGDVLYIRTEASGPDWLTYVASDLHAPKKDGLAEDPTIWGDGATPGRLLTISCIQPANPLAQSVQNAVVGWQYDRVVSEQQVAANMGD